MNKKLLLIFLIFLLFNGCIAQETGLPFPTNGSSDQVQSKGDLPNSVLTYQKNNRSEEIIVQKEIEKIQINQTEQKLINRTFTDIKKPDETETQEVNDSSQIIDVSINQEEEIEEFLEWTEERNIEVVGVNRSVNYFYYNGSKKEDFLDPKDVPNILDVAEGLYKIPENLMEVMDGKTIYLSHQYGRGYTVLGSWPDQGILAGMNKGIIIEQTLTSEQAVHEFGHILDYHGIRGMYDDPKNLWKNLDEERSNIFKVDFEYNPDLVEPPKGYMDVYSTANDAENFAQHFMYYLLKGNEFREKAENDELLKRKYEFFKQKLFDGEEFE